VPRVLYVGLVEALYEAKSWGHGIRLHTHCDHASTAYIAGSSSSLPTRRTPTALSAEGQCGPE
jgi:hypothetical protein